MKRYEVSGFGVMEYEEVASTNSLAEKLPLSELKDKQVILTWRQTQGRGQATNRWESAPGKNISMTVIFRPECLEAGKQIGRAALIAAIMEELERFYEIFQKTEDLSGLYEEYNQICVNCGRKIRVLEPGHEYTGVAEGINQDGELMVVRDDTGEKVSVYAGEVSVRGFYGYV